MALEKQKANQKNYKDVFLRQRRTMGRTKRLLTSFYDASISLMWKPEKDIISKDNYRPTSLVSMDAKTLNKILEN